MRARGRRRLGGRDTGRGLVLTASFFLTPCAPPSRRFRTPATPSPPPPAKKPSKPAPKPSKPSPVGPAGKCATKSNATIPSQFNLGKPAQAATPAACCARCAAVTACKGWTLNTKGACQLKTSGATQYESNYSSGSK